MDIKNFFAVVGAMIGIFSFFPYLRDTYLGKTKPHAYTWLVWTITQSIGVMGLWKGHAGWAMYSLTVGTCLVFVIFIFSLTKGTKNITYSDTFMLLLSLVAIFVWWQLHNPVLAVMVAAIADALGTIPTMRKSYFAPWSETTLTWFCFMLANSFALLSLREYNILTLFYLVTILSVNSTVFFICMIRRSQVPKQKV